MSYNLTKIQNSFRGKWIVFIPSYAHDGSKLKSTGASVNKPITASKGILDLFLIIILVMHSNSLNRDTVGEVISRQLEYILFSNYYYFFVCFILLVFWKERRKCTFISPISPLNVLALVQEVAV